MVLDESPPEARFGAPLAATLRYPILSLLSSRSCVVTGTGSSEGGGGGLVSSVVFKTAQPG